MLSKLVCNIGILDRAEYDAAITAMNIPDECRQWNENHWKCAGSRGAEEFEE
jgi:hypothetical protein